MTTVNIIVNVVVIGCVHGQRSSPMREFTAFVPGLCCTWRKQRGNGMNAKKKNGWKGWSRQRSLAAPPNPIAEVTWRSRYCRGVCGAPLRRDHFVYCENHPIFHFVACELSTILKWCLHCAAGILTAPNAVLDNKHTSFVNHVCWDREDGSPVNQPHTSLNAQMSAQQIDTNSHLFYSIIITV